MADYMFHEGKGLILNNLITSLVPTKDAPSKIIALDIDCTGDTYTVFNSLYYDRGFEKGFRRIELLEEPLFAGDNYLWKILSKAGSSNVLMELPIHEIYRLMEGNSDSRSCLRAREDFFLLFHSEEWVDGEDLTNCCLGRLRETLVKIKDSGKGSLFILSDFTPDDEAKPNRDISNAMADVIDDYYRFESKPDGLQYNIGFHHDTERAKKAG